MKKMLLISVILNLLGAIAIIFAIQRLGGLQFMYYRLNNQGLAGQYEHRKTLYEMLPESKGKTIFLGDSLTEGCEWAELFQNPDILNRGIAGDQTEGILKRLKLVLDLQPKQLFLMIGVNDLLFHSPEKIIDNYRKIVEQIHTDSPSTRLFLQSCLPVNNEVRNLTIGNEDLQTINQGIQKIASDYAVPFINLYPDFTDEKGNLNTDFTADGIHLNGKGYAVWRDKVADLILN